MRVRSVRIPEDIDKAIDYVARSEKLEKTSSFRKLTRLGFEFYVAKSYERGKLTLREAAGLLNLDLIETIDLLDEMGVKGNIRAKDIIESLKALPLFPHQGGGKFSRELDGPQLCCGVLHCSMLIMASLYAEKSLRSFLRIPTTISVSTLS